MVASNLDDVFELLQTTLRGDAAPARWTNDRPFYIYGAGNVGKDVYRLLKHQGFSVAGFLDRSATPGATWEGVPILAPDTTTLSDAQKGNAQVVIGIFNRDTEIAPIQKLLHALGYGLVISFLEFHARFSDELGDRFWLTSLTHYPSQRHNIGSANALWSDEISRVLFASILKFRFTRDYEALPQPNFTDQYFPTGLPAWPGPMRLIDCGAYDGDTLRHLAKSSTPVEAIAAFEPDPANYLKLAECARSLTGPVNGTLALFPCGVSSETGQVRFQAGRGEGSCASQEGDTVIQCVALDDALPGFCPTLIKMDIEGAEYDALHGARRLIERSRPGLAISVYHRPDDLWHIPLLLKSWLGGGRHYLRLHAHTGLELIYYWMP